VKLEILEFCEPQLSYGTTFTESWVRLEPAFENEWAENSMKEFGLLWLLKC
jgi:hypothetical protein